MHHTLTQKRLTQKNRLLTEKNLLSTKKKLLLTGKKLLLITFDYELFLGERSGNVQQCLVRTTERLLALLNRYDFKSIFFVDTVYLLRLQEQAVEHRLARADLEAVMEQLIRMLNSGHEIQPHIHPHWIDAVYDPETNEWCLPDKRYYTFAGLPEEKRTELFDKSIALIRSIQSMARRTHPVDAYRAGGWSIQAFDNFRPHFQKHGIIHEFSVIPGRYLYSDAHHFDFRSAPADQPVYHFSRDVCKRDDLGNFTEWTISSLPRTAMQQWIYFKINGMLHRLRICGKYGGTAIAFNVKEQGDIYNSGKATRQIASFEGLNPYQVMRFVRRIKRQDYFHFISHPKLLNEFEIRMVGLLLWSLSRNRKINTDFRKHLRVD
jgi:peptidoglycan/xylan/chitin deacetylase (PgdA/CDA1 family)